MGIARACKIGLFVLDSCSVFEITFGTVDSNNGIMTGGAVFYNKSGDWCFGMFIEQRVVTYTKAKTNIQLSSGFIK